VSSVVEEDEFKKMLEYRGAKNAFERLVNHHADQMVLRNLLMLRMIFGEIPKNRPQLPPRRSIDSVTATMRALAGQIRDFATFPGIVTEFFAGVVTSVNGDPLREQLIGWAGLCEILLTYARILDNTNLIRPLMNAAEWRNRAVRYFCDYIRDRTGKNRYADVALLLNAADNIATTGERWDAQILAQLMYRERLRSISRQHPR
jgi:hypothetical protein